MNYNWHNAESIYWGTGEGEASLPNSPASAPTGLSVIVHYDTTVEDLSSVKSQNASAFALCLGGGTCPSHTLAYSSVINDGSPPPPPPNFEILDRTLRLLGVSLATVVVFPHHSIFWYLKP